MERMIKFLTVSLIAIIISTSGSAQGRYEKGSAILNLGLGVGGYFHAAGTPFLGSLEFGVSDVVTIGPYLGFTSFSDTWYYSNNYYIKQKYAFIDIGVRGAYHFSDAIGINDENLDLYAGAALGAVITKYSQTIVDNTGFPSGSFNPTTPENQYPTAIKFGIFGGVRYFFSPKFGAHAELGYGLAPLSIGITFRVK